MLKLLSGNEAFALGAYHAGVRVATAYPGTPSTEILEAIAQHKDLYAEWSTNEKVALEVALGAAYTGVRALVSMKQVGLNVASDPFLAASTTGINGGLVVISADDPGIHSSQNEQDNRHYVKLAKVPMLEPSDSQEAYDLMAHAYDISERFDTPVLMRTTTRLSHSKSVVQVNGNRRVPDRPVAFARQIEKYVMLPVNARLRHPLVEERMVKLATFSETFPLNRIEWGDRRLGVVASGVAYQYAREAFPKASFLRLGMPYPLPKDLVRRFAAGVKQVIVIEELDPFLQENILALGVKVTGKEFIPRAGELNPGIIEQGAQTAGLLPRTEPPQKIDLSRLPRRPPLLCAGCPHTGLFFVLASLGQRLKLPGARDKAPKEPAFTITGDIGCYTLGTYPPLSAMDTTACMGASIGQATGMQKAGLARKVVAVIGDSTFLHSGITPLVNAVYNEGQITVVILDNGTTAMTGHQDHPGTGVSAQGKPTHAVKLEDLVRGMDIDNVRVLDAFNVKELRTAVKESLAQPDLSVLIVRGACAVRAPKGATARAVDAERCSQCGTCLMLGCQAIQSVDGQVCIDAALCVGKACTTCEQVCPKRAIGAAVQA